MKISLRLLQNQRASLVAQKVKNLPAVQETWVDPRVRKIPWRREWQPTPVFLPGESHGGEAWRVQSMGLKRIGHNLATKQQEAAPHPNLISKPTLELLLSNSSPNPPVR